MNAAMTEVLHLALLPLAAGTTAWTTILLTLLSAPVPAARLGALIGTRREEEPLPRIGICATLTAVIARLDSGGTATAAFEEVGGVRFATPRATEARIAAVLRRRSRTQETEEQIGRVAWQAERAVALGSRLGCGSSQTLRTVEEAHRRACLAEDRRRQAFAAPEATIRLLTALPAVTVLLGELLGAEPMAFLLGSPQGLACLLLGGAWHAVGLAWVRRLLRTLDDGGVS